MANRTTLVDNNTWNNSHIALVGKAMSSNESAAYKIMTALDVDYVLVIFGGVIGYSGDDINKFLWMVRIAEGEHPNDIRESDYFTDRGEFRVDAAGAPTLLNCLMYKLSYYRFGELQVRFQQMKCSAFLQCANNRGTFFFPIDGLPFACWLRSNSSDGDWQQEHSSGAPGRGVHH